MLGRGSMLKLCTRWLFHIITHTEKTRSACYRMAKKSKRLRSAPSLLKVINVTSAMSNDSASLYKSAVTRWWQWHKWTQTHEGKRSILPLTSVLLFLSDFLSELFSCLRVCLFTALTSSWLQMKLCTVLYCSFYFFFSLVSSLWASLKHLPRCLLIGLCMH